MLKSRGEIEEGQRLKQEWIPLSIAVLCLDCHAIFRLNGPCPGCGGNSVMLVSHVIMLDG